MLDVLAQVLGLMDEPTLARDLMARLAKDVRPEHSPLAEAASCAPEAGATPGARASTTVCVVGTPCGAPARVAVFFEPLTGAVTDRIDVADQVHAVCPEMLTDAAARLVAARSLGEDLQ